MVVQGLPDEYRAGVEESLSSFNPFIGWVKVDRSNPIHVDLFAVSLFKDMFIDRDGIAKSSDWEDGEEDREGEISILKSYGSKYEPRLLSSEQFLKFAPKLLNQDQPDERSMLSVQRVAGEKPSHRANIGKALVFSHEAVGGFRTFSISKPEDGIEFQVPEAKLTKYLLNLDHEKGAPKAQFFRDTLNIVKEDWRYLADQLSQAAAISDFYRLEVTGYGIMHGAQVLITGRNGRKAVIETGWKLEATGPAHFVTAYPGDERKIELLQCVPVRVPEISCNTPERWKKIHEMAHNSGMLRGENKMPTPMVLEQWGTIWDGACGFGWVFLPSAREPFAKWALKVGIGYHSRPGVHINSKMHTQSMDKNYAYALGYAEVLKANGIDCRAECRLD